MRNKGFSLVELVVVIALIGLIMTIIMSATINSREQALNKMDEEMKKNIKSAAEMYAIDLDDSDSNEYNCKELSEWCTKDNGMWDEVEISLNSLIQKGYFQDSSKHCDEDENKKITIERNNGNYIITGIESINCKN